jgi:hypothetical protein
MSPSKVLGMLLGVVGVSLLGVLLGVVLGDSPSKNCPGTIYS